MLRILSRDIFTIFIFLIIFTLTILLTLLIYKSFSLSEQVISIYSNTYSINKFGVFEIVIKKLFT